MFDQEKKPTTCTRHTVCIAPNIKTDKHFIDLIIFVCSFLLAKFLSFFLYRPSTALWQIHYYDNKKRLFYFKFNLKSLILSCVQSFNGNFSINAWWKDVLFVVSSLWMSRNFESSYKIIQTTANGVNFITEQIYLIFKRAR